MTRSPALAASRGGDRLEAVLDGQLVVLRARPLADDDRAAAVAQVLGVGVPLAAVADDGDRLALEQSEVGVLVVIHRRRHGRRPSFVLVGGCGTWSGRMRFGGTVRRRSTTARAGLALGRIHTITAGPNARSAARMRPRRRGDHSSRVARRYNAWCDATRRPEGARRCPFTTGPVSKPGLPRLPPVWITHLKEALNDGRSSEGYYALAEQHAGADDRRRPDAAGADRAGRRGAGRGGLAVEVAPPQIRRKLMPTPEATYRRAAAVAGDPACQRTSPGRPGGDRLAVEQGPAEVGRGVRRRRSSTPWRRASTCCSSTCSRPARHDPFGLHGAIWAAFGDPAEAVEPGRPLTLASYVAHGGRGSPRPTSSRSAWATRCPRCPSS